MAREILSDLFLVLGQCGSGVWGTRWRNRHCETCPVAPDLLISRSVLEGPRLPPQGELRSGYRKGYRFIYVPNTMFIESFWCAHPLALVLEENLSYHSDLSPSFVGGGVWLRLNFHVLLLTSSTVTRVLSRVFCLAVSTFCSVLCNGD